MASFLSVEKRERRKASFSAVSSWESWRSHWKGVCGLGTNGDTAAVTWRRLTWGGAVSRTLRHRSKMPWMSARVSVGRPIMK